MKGVIRQLLFGETPTRYHRYGWPIIAVMAALVSFGADATGVFYIEGRVILIPGQAALLGMLLAFATGYARAGLLLAWLGMYGLLIGHRADHAFLGLSG